MSGPVVHEPRRGKGCRVKRCAVDGERWPCTAVLAELDAREEVTAS